MTGYATAFLAGFWLALIITRLGAMRRACCREHFKTHEDCPCADCARDRGEP